jgi:hypothetical protein
MKRVSLAIILIASLSILAISCDWFKSEPKPVTSSNPLIGKWKLDSVRMGKDTSFAYALLFMAMHEDSSGIGIRFQPDTLFTYSKNDVDTTFYKFDEKSKLLSFKDSTEKSYQFIKLNDSLISLQREDSSAFFLKKQ